MGNYCQETDFIRSRQPYGWYEISVDETNLIADGDRYISPGVRRKQIRQQLDHVIQGAWSISTLSRIIFLSREEDYNLVRLIYGV